MPLKRISSQGGSLAGHYTEYAGVRGNPQMLELLPCLENVCVLHDVWGLTSLHTLWLVAEDNGVPMVEVNGVWRPRWQISVSHDGDTFKVSYRMSPDTAPFEGAFVEGWRQKPDEAAKIVAIGIASCGAWR